MKRIRLLLVSALMLAAFVMTTANPAPAATCQYGGGPSDNGPCMQFENKASWNFSLYCLQGYPSTTHRIHMTPGDSFTCKVRDRNAPVAKTERNKYWTEFSWICHATNPDKQINRRRPEAEGGWEQRCRR